MPNYEGRAAAGPSMNEWQDLGPWAVERSKARGQKGFRLCMLAMLHSETEVRGALKQQCGKSKGESEARETDKRSRNSDYLKQTL